MFVVDEVGQFVARDVQKMLDLQASVQKGYVSTGRGLEPLTCLAFKQLSERGELKSEVASPTGTVETYWEREILGDTRNAA